MDVMSLADRSWPVLRRLMGLHTAAYRLSNGLIGHRFPGSPPMLLLEHVGAKSGTKRTIPLVYVDDGDNVGDRRLQGGTSQEPGLVPQPAGQSRDRGPDRPASDALSGRGWRARRNASACGQWRVATYAGYRGYQERTGREIPLVILEPR